MKWLQAYESFKNDNPKKYFIIYNRDIPPISGRDSSINYKMNNMLISNIFDDIIILTETSLNQIQDWLKTINPGDMIFSYNNNSLRTYEKLNPSQKKLKYIAETLRRKKDIKFWINDSFTRSKTDYYNLLKNYDFMPKTCFSKKEALETLNFPIVAKPEGGSLGIGIQKFNTKGEFEKTRYRFDVFSEYVKHKAEFRVLVLNGKIIFVVERINEFSDKNNIDHKTKNSEVMHIYVPQNMDTFPYLKKIQKVVNIIDKRLGKHTESVYSIDLFITPDNEVKVIESNSKSQLGPMSLMSVCSNLFDIPYHIKFLMNNAKKLYLQNQYKKYKKQINNSVHPIDYDLTKVDDEFVKFLNTSLIRNL